MLHNRSRLFTHGCFLLSVLFCVVGGASIIRRYQEMTSCYSARAALRSLEVTIDVSQSQALAEQLERFAKKHDFRFRIAHYSPNGEDFSVWLERKDVEAVTRNPFVPGEFKSGFYNNDCMHPTIASDLSDLEKDPESHISQIPNVTITKP